MKLSGLSDTAKMLQMLFQDPQTLEDCVKFANDSFRSPEGTTQMIKEFCVESQRMWQFAQDEKLWKVGETGRYDMGPIHWDLIAQLLRRAPKQG